MSTALVLVAALAHAASPETKFTTSADYIVIEGGWKSDKGSVFDFGKDRASTIVCHRKLRRCNESRAWSNGKGHVATLPLEYRIDAWTEEAVHAVLAASPFGVGGDRLDLFPGRHEARLTRIYPDRPPIAAWMGEPVPTKK